ncbi:hypothetical protein BGW39_004978 [Mortierella sp. 14UC]|nr:hypothetical protein BGW39_004978 [Mortierella sp. 14UC]
MVAIISTFVESLDFTATLATLVALLTAYIFYNVYLLPDYISPFRLIPGPPNKSKHNKYHIPLLGLFLDILREEVGVPFGQWIEEYGDIVCYRALFNAQHVLVADPRAITHIFSTYAYQCPKPNRVIRLLGMSIGRDILLVEGDVHKRQRKMFNPAFSHNSVREMIPIMASPAQFLSKMWEKLVEEAEDKSVEMNAVLELSACTLDIIGLTGFGFDFKGLTRPGNDVVEAYNEYFSSKAPTILQFFRHYVPYYSKLPLKHNRDRMQSVRSVERVTRQIIQEKRTQAAGAINGEEGKDLINILIRANESSQGLSQTDDLKAQELFRIISTIHTTARVATEDDVIPGYRIPKGTEIYLSAATLHKLKSVWGEDAEEFKPERWMDSAALTEEQRQTTKTVTPDMMWAYMPFLTGLRNCIGSKLTLMEIKVVLYYHLTNLEYHPVPGFKFRKSSRVNLRLSPGMNLIMTPFKDRTE